MAMFADAQKYLKRKVKKLDYIHTKLPDNYEINTKTYKKLRDDIDVLSSVIKGFTNYEFGGAILKNFSHIRNVIADTSKTKFLSKNDIYTDAVIVGEQLHSCVDDKAFKETSKSFSDAYAVISEAKTEMNAKLNEALVSLNVLKKNTKQIDMHRNQVENLRYDLEEMLQKGNVSESERTSLTTELNVNAKGAMDEMSNFIGKAGISSILTSVASIHAAFSKKAADALSKVK
jgi:hypothetical protein